MTEHFENQLPKGSLKSTADGGKVKVTPEKEPLPPSGIKGFFPSADQIDRFAVKKKKKKK